jgi:hypothetical protein
MMDDDRTEDEPDLHETAEIEPAVQETVEIEPAMQETVEIEPVPPPGPAHEPELSFWGGGREETRRRRRGGLVLAWFLAVILGAAAGAGGAWYALRDTAEPSGTVKVVEPPVPGGIPQSESPAARVARAKRS